MISIIVPVYNVAAYLPKCLQSLAQQTEKDIEIIIVNDGSTDGSDKICQEFIAGKEKFRYFSKENGGLMSAWMEGVKHVKGDYIGFVDSDDYVEETMFEKLYTKAKETGAEIVMCKCFYEQIANGRIVNQTIQNNEISEGLYVGAALEEIRTKMFPLPAESYISPSRCSKLIKKDILVQNLQYCDPFIASGEDVNIILPCFFACKSFYYLDDAKYHYIKNVQSISHSYKPTLQEQYIRLLNKIATAIKDYSIDVPAELWDKVVNSYGMMLLRMILQARLKKNKKKQAVQDLFQETMFLQSANNRDTSLCEKWERAYISSMNKQATRPFQRLLLLSKIKKQLWRLKA